LLGNKPNADETVLSDDVISQCLRRLHLLPSQILRVQIDGTGVGPHMKRNRRKVEKAHEGGREQVLPGVLLHVVAAPFDVNQTANVRAFRNWGCRFEQVQDGVIVSLYYFGDARLAIVRNNPARIESLPAGSRIKRRPIQNDRSPPVGGANVENIGFEFRQKRIVIIKTLGHNLEGGRRLFPLVIPRSAATRNLLPPVISNTVR